MLTRGYSGTRAGAFIIPLPGAIGRAMKRRPRCDPRPNGRAQRCPCPAALVRGTSLSKDGCASTAASSSRSISLPSALLLARAASAVVQSGGNRSACIEVNLRRGFVGLGIGLAVLWFVFWTCAYVMRPLASENAQPLPALSTSRSSPSALWAYRGSFQASVRIRVVKSNQNWYSPAAAKAYSHVFASKSVIKISGRPRAPATQEAKSLSKCLNLNRNGVLYRRYIA